jgi:hypothetical protein
MIDFLLSGLSFVLVGLQLRSPHLVKSMSA